MTIVLFCMSMSVLLLVLIFALREFNKQMSRYVGIMTGTRQDEAVDEYFMKAVIISADMYRGDKAIGIELEKKVIERACVIVSDVLLQHGISPKKYNLEGLTRLAMHKVGMLKLPGSRPDIKK